LKNGGPFFTASTAPTSADLNYFFKIPIPRVPRHGQSRGGQPSIGARALFRRDSAVVHGGGDEGDLCLIESRCPHLDPYYAELYN
jgi:hypothetical protein